MCVWGGVGGDSLLSFLPLTHKKGNVRKNETFLYWHAEEG